jgi:hypothetical protein
MAETVVRLGDVEATVGLWHLHFPNGGGWSYFLCPTCGQKAQRLRLLFGQVLCRRCLLDRGVRGRLEPLSVKQRAEVMAPRLIARLGSDKSERLKPVLWGKLERRSRHETALARNEFILSQGRRYRDVLKQTQAMEIEPELIKKPKIKSPRKR